MAEQRDLYCIIQCDISDRELTDCEVDTKVTHFCIIGASSTECGEDSDVVKHTFVKDFVTCRKCIELIEYWNKKSTL